MNMGMKSTGDMIGESRMKRSVGGKAKLPKKPKKMRSIGIGDMQMGSGMPMMGKKMG